jgi:hypothetical protein
MCCAALTAVLCRVMLTSRCAVLCCVMQVHLQCIPDRHLPAVPCYHHLARPLDLGPVAARDDLPGESHLQHTCVPYLLMCY